MNIAEMVKEMHQEIRNKAIDEFAKHLNLQFFIEDDVLFDKVTLYKIVNKIAEEMKKGK